MIYEYNTSRREGGNAIAREVNESTIQEDIRYFESRIQDIGKASSSHDRAMLRVYNSLLSYRCQMMVAYQDGRPEAWVEYQYAAR